MIIIYNQKCKPDEDIDNLKEKQSTNTENNKNESKDIVIRSYQPSHTFLCTLKKEDVSLISGEFLLKHLGLDPNNQKLNSLYHIENTNDTNPKCDIFVLKEEGLKYILEQTNIHYWGDFCTVFIIIISTLIIVTLTNAYHMSENKQNNAIIKISR